MENSLKKNINNEGIFARKKAVEILIEILQNNRPLDSAFEISTKKVLIFLNLQMKINHSADCLYQRH